LAAELAALHIEPEQLEKMKRALESAAEIKDNSMDALKRLADLDMEFHRIIYAASDNRQLKEMIESLLYKMSMYWFQVGFSAVEFREQFEELEALFIAIKQRDRQEAKHIMKQHIDHFTRLIKDNMF